MKPLSISDPGVIRSKEIEVSIQLMNEGASLNALTCFPFIAGGKSYIVLLTGKNEIEKLRKPTRLIKHGAVTQETFGINMLTSVWQRFEGEGHLGIRILQLEKKMISIVSTIDVPFNGDILRIEHIQKDELHPIIGLVTSTGAVEVIKLDLLKMLNLKGNSFETLYSAHYSNPDEILSCLEFISEDRLLIGGQKGTVFMLKILSDGLRVINSWNRLENFMITNISLMPSTPGEKEVIFAYSTCDGVIRIQSTLRSSPIYEYQTISVKTTSYL